MNKKNWYLGAAVLGVLLSVGLIVPAYAKVTNWLFGEALRVATPYAATSGTPDVSLVAGAAYIQGAIEVDGAARLDGTLRLGAATSSFAAISVSTATVGATAFVIDGSYTTAQIQAKTPSAAGQLIYNSTANNVCVSTGTTIQGYKFVGTASTACQ